MGGPEDDKKSDPPSSQPRPDEESTKTELKPASEATHRQSVLEHARKFLEEDEVRDASTDKKIAFLESKGLQGDEIEKLLGVARNSEASSPAPEPSPPSTEASRQTPSIEPVYAAQQGTAPPQPPIITYPEFLTQAQHPAPLITQGRLLNTLYLFSGLSFLLYGTHNYLVTPMLASLTMARLSLFSTASENLNKLVSQLEGMVSELPPTYKRPTKAAGEGDSENGDNESDEDPAELFHRDVGVQTSLPSTPASPSLAAQPSSVTDDHATRLTTLKASIESVIEDSTSEGYDQQELETTIGALKEYCDGLAFIPATSYAYGAYGGSVSGGRDEKDDEISRVKAGIRGVKGVLLSARSFPGGVRAGVK